MQLITSACKIFHLTPLYIRNMSYVELMWMLKEYNDMYNYNNKKKDEKDGFKDFKGIKGVNFTQN